MIIINLIQFKSETFTAFIFNYKKENKSNAHKADNELEKKIKDKIEKNKKLEEENKKLKNENEKLKSDLLKANKIISGIQNNQINNNEIKKLKDENQKLIVTLYSKDSTVNERIKCLSTDIFAEVEEKLH